MADLFDRRWSIQIGTLDVSELDITFNVVKSTKREPNTAEVTIRNLSEDSRSKVEGAEGESLTVRAGYLSDDIPPTIFAGDARRILSEPDGIDIITTIQARDFGRLYQLARVNKSYGPGTPVETVLRDLVSAMGVGPGNLEEFAPAYTLRNGSTNFADGYVTSGPVRRAMNALVRGAGLRWSIQNNALQLQRRGQPLQSTAALLRSDTGLVGSPTKDRKGVVTATTLIQSGLDPGRRVSLDTRLVSGEYEVRRVEYTGETRGNPWYANLELRPIQ